MLKYLSAFYDITFEWKFTNNLVSSYAQRKLWELELVCNTKKLYITHEGHCL